MEDLAEKWTSEANSVLTLGLMDEEGHESQFRALFTYPIYGDKEMIWGYDGLALNLKFDATTLLPLATQTYKHKLKGDPDVKNPVDQLLEKLPESAYTDYSAWELARKKEHLKFELPGEQVGDEFQATDGKTYVVQRVKLDSAEMKELHHRLRIFILLFIEAGSFIDEDDDRWEFYLVYQQGPPHPKFVGFSSAYPYFYYKDSATHDLFGEHEQWPIRMRISQFVILPPFQGQHLGKYLYNALFEEFLSNDRIREVTVEDPSEKFDDLRDRCDLERLAKRGVLSSTKLQNAREVDPTWVEKKRENEKIAPRQFARCIEMALLHTYANHKQQPDKAYKLYVKRRLYIRNHEAMGDFTKQERIDKLDEVYTSLIEDYHRVIEPVDFADDAKGKGKKRAHNSIS